MLSYCDLKKKEQTELKLLDLSLNPSHLLFLLSTLLWPANIQDCMLSKVSLKIDTSECKTQTNGLGCAPSITPTEDSLFADFSLEEFLPFFSCETHKSWADKESCAGPGRARTELPGLQRSHSHCSVSSILPKTRSLLRNLPSERPFTSLNFNLKLKCCLRLPWTGNQQLFLL